MYRGLTTSPAAEQPSEMETAEEQGKKFLLSPCYRDVSVLATGPKEHEVDDIILAYPPDVKTRQQSNSPFWRSCQPKSTAGAGCPYMFSASLFVI